jgi:hypothetical protein
MGSALPNRVPDQEYIVISDDQDPPPNKRRLIRKYVSSQDQEQPVGPSARNGPPEGQARNTSPKFGAWPGAGGESADPSFVGRNYLPPRDPHDKTKEMEDFTYALEKAWPALMSAILQGNVDAVKFEVTRFGRPRGWTYRLHRWSYCFKLTTPEVLNVLRNGIRRPDRFKWDPGSFTNELNHYLDICCAWPPQVFDQNDEEFHDLGESMLGRLHHHRHHFPEATRKKIDADLYTLRTARQDDQHQENERRQQEIKKAAERQIKQRQRLWIEANAGQIQRRTAEAVRAAPAKDPAEVNRWVTARTRRSNVHWNPNRQLAAAYDKLVPAGPHAGPQETPFDLKSLYKARVLTQHPDRGGTHERFIQLADSKAKWQKASPYQRERVLQDARKDR